MTKYRYLATDPDGAVHKRTSESRSPSFKPYAYTVVRKGGYQTAMASATETAYSPKADARNYAYYVQIAEGNDPYPRSTFRAKHPERFTAEEIAEEKASVDAENERRYADANERVGNHTVQSYVAAQRAWRIAHVEERKARGDFEVWHNMGWCSRLDLAQKLAAKEQAKGDYEVAILPVAS